MAPHRAPYSAVTLRFADDVLEAEYRSHERAVNAARTRTGLLIGLAVLFVYVVRDRLIADPLVVDSDLRMFVAMPAVLLALAATLRPGPNMYPTIIAALAVMLFCYPIGLVTGGAQYTNASAFSFIQAVLFLNILTLVPFRYACPVALSSGVAMLGALGFLGAETVLTKQLLSIVFVVTTLSSYVTWSREYSQRRLFVRQREINRLTQQRLEAQALQIDWLKNLPIQISTDMQNRLFAIEEDVERALDESGRDNKRLEQVLKRISVLMDTLATTRFARDLQERKLVWSRIDLGDLVTEAVTARARGVMDSCAIELRLEANLFVLGDRTLLISCVNQLLNAATSELGPEHAVALRGFRDGGQVVCELRLVSPLPESRPLSDHELRAGLGIFVASKVIELHGGTLTTVTRRGDAYVRAALPFSVGDEGGQAASDGPRRGAVRPLTNRR